MFMMKILNTFILFFLLSVYGGAQVLKIGSKIDTASKNNIQSLDSLIHFIDKNSSSDYEKAFGVYYWIAHHVKYDYKKFKKGKPSYSKPQDVFRKRKAVCYGYTTLYRYMCSEMNVNCQLIAGYSKGFGYKGGQSFLHSDHAWNAVKIDSVWQLLDVTWASGFLKKKLFWHSFVPKYSDKYFAVDPHYFVQKHLPEVPMWQIINNAVPLKVFASGNKKMDEFLKLPPSPFFFYKDTIRSFLHLDSIKQLLLEGQMALVFNSHNTAPLALAIMNSLQYKIKHDSSDLRNSSLRVLDSMIGACAYASILLDKAKGNEKSFKKKIERAKPYAHYLSGNLYWIRGGQIKIHQQPDLIKHSLDSLRNFSQDYFFSVDKALKEFRKASESPASNVKEYVVYKTTVRSLEEAVYNDYARLFYQYRDWYNNESNVNSRKLIQKELNWLINKAKGTFPSGNKYSREISRNFIYHI